MSAQILDGTRVLDLTRVLAGPWCTQTLAEMGAEVVKIESPDGGDESRRLPPHVHLPGTADSDISTFFVACNRGKKSVVVDIKTHEGQEAIRAMAKDSDVFVENFKVGNLAAYGLDYAALSKINPRLIYCSITGYGQSGPMASFPGYDILFQGMSGAMSTCGLPDGEPGGGPMRTLVAYTDVMTGMYATTAILGALLHARKTGEGQYIDIALLDVAVAANAHIASTFLLAGKSQPRVGNSGIAASPSGVYRCVDGNIIIQSSVRQWPLLCDALGKSEWKRDSRFESLSQRLQNGKALDALIQQVTQGWHREELIKCIAGAGVPCAAVNTIGEAFSEPQVVARQLVESVHVEGIPDLAVVRSPIRLSRTPLSTLPPPRLGQHTDKVLNEIHQKKVRSA